MLVTAWEEAALHAAGFLVGFFGLLVGSKVALAITLSHTRRRVSQRAYRGLLAAAAALLLIASVALLAEFLPQVFHRGNRLERDACTSCNALASCGVVSQADSPLCSG
jgi:hypothetical protein